MSAPRVLVVCERAPLHPRDGGDGITIIGWALGDLRPDVAQVELLWPGMDAAMPRRRGLRRWLGRVGRFPGEAAWSDTPTARHTVWALSRAADAVVFVGSTSFLLARAVTDRPCLFHEVDPFSLVWRTAPGAGLTRLRNRLRASRARALERFAARRGTLVVVSAADAVRLGAVLEHPVAAIPIGFTAPPAGLPAGDEPIVVFAGNLGWEPNVASARDLAERVLPAVRERRPDARLRLVGARPADAVLALQGGGVEVWPDVPDMLAALRQCAVAAFPGGFGWGIRGSVLSALAAGLAVVASPAAACGLPPGQHLLVADDEAMPGVVADLLADPARRAAMGAAAMALVQRWPSWRESAAAVVDRAVAAAQGRTEASTSRSRAAAMPVP